jgi:putative membrane protein
MVHVVASILIAMVSLLLTVKIVPGARLVDGRSALAAGLVLGALRLTVGKLLLMLCLPLRLLQFGLAAVLIHALLLRLTRRLVRGFELRGFGATMLAAVCLTVLVKALSWLLL